MRPPRLPVSRSGLDYLTLSRSSRRRCRAARASASAWPRRSARRSWACCISSTSRPSACTSAITTSCSRTLKRLRDLGNTLIVVEHDEDTMRAADYIVDIGPGAGVQRRRDRGRAGTLDEICCRAALRHRPVPVRQERRSPCPRSAARATARSCSVSAAARKTTSSTSTSRFPLGTLHLRDRRLRLGQVARSSTRSSTRRSPPSSTAHRRARASSTASTGLEHLDKVIDIDQ